MALSYRAAQTAIKRGDENALRAALASGMDANLVNGNGWTLLMLAAVEGRTAIGHLLLLHGARATDKNNRDESALSLARQKHHEAFAQLLETTCDASPSVVTEG